MPGSTLFSALQHKTASWELLDNLIWTHGRHVAKFGGGVLFRHLDGVLTAGADGQVGFLTALDFAADRPARYRAPFDRSALPTMRVPDFLREYGSTQFFFFAQDTYKVTSRLALNYGIRYESYGGPVNEGPVKDAVIELGGGQTSRAYRGRQNRVSHLGRSARL